MRDACPTYGISDNQFSNCSSGALQSSFLGQHQVPYSGIIIPNMGIYVSSQESSSTLLHASFRRSALADALFTTTRQRVLALLFGQPQRDFFVTEIINLIGMGRGAVQRELARLAESGLAVASQKGNRKFYRANKTSPFFDELCGIVRKTSGVEASIRHLLEPLFDRLTLALVYGSVARGTETATSDIDILLASEDLTLEEVYLALEPAEKLLGQRRVNPILYTPSELRKRREDRSPFVTQVLEGPHIILTGQIDGA